MAGSAFLMGQANAAADPGAKIWELASGADDDGTAFEIYGLSNWIAPALGGGVCAFKRAYVTLTWSMDVALRFTPKIDEDPESTARPGGTIDVMPVDVTLAAPASGRSTRTFVVPLVRLVKDGSGNELGRNAVVGTRLRLEIESVGGLGAGDLILAGAEVEFEELADDKASEG